MFVKYGGEYADIVAWEGLSQEARAVRAQVDEMTAAILGPGWGSAWFRRAYDANGRPVGSAECAEGKIYIEPQGMCVMAGVGLSDGRALQALESVRRHLDTEYGILLLQPAPHCSIIWNWGDQQLPPGYKENAGIFCHNNPWISCAECAAGRSGRAFEVYRRTCPAYREGNQRDHRTEPYVYNQMIAGRDAAAFSERKNNAN